MAQDELNTIFGEEVSKYADKKYSYADELIEKVETEYKNMGAATTTRQSEKKDLTKKLATLTAQLKKIKNSKNVRVASSNSSGLSAKRLAIKKEIEKTKDRLYEIEIEEKGADIGSVDVTNSGSGATASPLIPGLDSIPRYEQVGEAIFKGISFD